MIVIRSHVIRRNTGGYVPFVDRVHLYTVVYGIRNPRPGHTFLTPDTLRAVEKGVCSPVRFSLQDTFISFYWANVRYDRGIYIVIKDGKVIAQGHSCVKIVDALQSNSVENGIEFQLANLILVRADLQFRLLLHFSSNGYGLMTPPRQLVYHIQNGNETRAECSFLIDTGSTLTCVSQALNPFAMRVRMDVETRVGVHPHQLTKIQLKINEQTDSILAYITQAPVCILGMDILRYYTITIDGDRAGLLIKNNRAEWLEEDFILWSKTKN